MRNQAKASLNFSLDTVPETRLQRLARLFAKVLLAVIFFLGFSLSLFDNFLPPVALPLLLCLGCVACVLYTFILQSKRPVLALLAILGWLVIFVLVLHTDVLNGLKLTANHWANILGRHFGQNYSMYEVTVAESGYKLSTSIFAVPFVFLLALLASYLARNRDILVAFFFLAMTVFSQVYFRLEIKPLYLGFLILAIVLLLILRFDRRPNFYNGRADAYRLAAVLTALLLLIVGVLAHLLLPQPEKSPLAGKRDQLLRSADRWRYGVDPDLGMPDGDFTNLAPFEPTNDTALEVSMSEPESLWLRGYVGSSYTGSGWEGEDPAVLYDYADLFYWLHVDNFYGQKQLADAALVTGEASREQAQTIKVNNVAASSRNIYAPYEVVGAGEDLLQARGIGDAELENTGWRGQRNYRYETLPNLVKRYPDVINGLYKEDNSNMLYTELFLFVESNYAKFVYDLYTVLPEGVEEWLTDYLGDILPRGEEASYASVKQAIITYLTEETTYSTTPRSTGTSDFARDFLLIDKVGYSVHYATAATLMFRFSGIPARYVEGYLITPEDVAGAPSNTVFHLDGTHAHAWVEVYQSGVGWIPVEVTPPYFGLMEEADMVKGVASPKTEQKEVPEPEQNLVVEQPERPEELEDRFKTAQGMTSLLLLGILLLILILTIFFIRRYLKYRCWLNQHLSVCRHEDTNVAVIAMFASGLDALAKLGQDTQGVWLWQIISSNIEERTGLTEERLATVFATYEEAAYSGQTVSSEQRHDLAAFLAEIHVLLRRRFKGLKRLSIFRLDRLLTRLAGEG